MAGALRRVPAGAHYGLRPWLIQRVTAVLLAAYLLALGGGLLLAGHVDYAAWSALFAPLPVKLASALAVLALAWHAWIGVRDVWMDYVGSTGLRLALHTATAVWLLYCLAWAVRILWSA